MLRSWLQYNTDLPLIFFNLQIIYQQLSKFCQFYTIPKICLVISEDVFLMLQYVIQT